MGINKNNFILLLFAFFAFGGSLHGQNGSDPYIYNGKWVEDVLVEKGRTIYNITKTYQISEDELRALNPELKDGLKAGMKIRVPVTMEQPKIEEKKEPKVPKTPELSGAIKHTVKKKETIYGIAKMYGVEIEDIYAINPQANQGLAPGMILTIYPKPSSKPPSREQFSQRDTTPADSLPLKVKPFKCKQLTANEQKRTIKVSLLLPFFLPPGEELNARSRIGLDFYAGSSLAADSLKKEGFSIEFHVFDTQNDSATVNKVISRSEFRSSDLIIGPLYSQAFKTVADKARELGIPAVTPFSQSDALTEGYPNVIKITPSQDELSKALAIKLIQQFPSGKFIFVQSGLEKDKSLIENFKSGWELSDLEKKPELKEMSMTEFRSDQSVLDPIKQNIVIFLSNDEVRLIELSNRLDKSAESHRIRLVGLQEWNSFDNVDQEILNRLQFTYASNLRQDFDSGRSRAFQKKYLEEFKGEPSFYAYQGYDVTCYFARFIAEYGKEGLECLLSAKEICGLNGCYLFSKNGKDNGFNNLGIGLIELKNFKQQYLVH